MGNLRNYLSVITGTDEQALPSGTISSTVLTEQLISSSATSCLGKNSACSCILPLCISEVRFGGLGGGGVCSGGGSRSSLESSFHCSFRKKTSCEVSHYFFYINYSNKAGTLQSISFIFRVAVHLHQ